jgi:hypothetical protein
VGKGASRANARAGGVPTISGPERKMVGTSPDALASGHFAHPTALYDYTTSSACCMSTPKVSRNFDVMM